MRHPFVNLMTKLSAGHESLKTKIEHIFSLPNIELNQRKKEIERDVF
jgi:hypothetical protein